MTRVITQKERDDRRRKSRGYKEFEKLAEFMITKDPTKEEILWAMFQMLDNFAAFRYRWIAYATTEQVKLLVSDLKAAGKLK